MGTGFLRKYPAAQNCARTQVDRAERGFEPFWAWLSWSSGPFFRTFSAFLRFQEL